MTMTVDFDDDDLIDGFGTVIPINLQDSATVSLNALPPEASDRISRVITAGSTIVQRPALLPLDLEERLSEIPEVQHQVARVADAVGIAGQPIRVSILNPQRPSALAEGVLNTIASESLEDRAAAQDFFAEMKEDLEESLPIPRSEREIMEVMEMDHIEVVANAAAGDFPDVARLIMRLGMEMESRTTKNKILRYKKEAEECKARMDKLLKLSAELPRMNTDDGSYELKEEVKAKILQLAKELKEEGMDIFPGSEIAGEITKDQLAGANSLINHYIDQNKTTLQELFTTKISVSIQFLQMMNEIMKKISELDDRQKKKAIEEARR